MEGMVKRFGPTLALDRAGLRLAADEVHAIVGENGAGKTTLLGLLGGVLKADAGVVEVDGHPTSIRTPREAWALGIGLVHQHFTLVPRMSVLENLVLGSRSRAAGWRLPLQEIRTRAEALSRKTGLAVDFDAPVETLGVGQRQRVEILKVLLRAPRVLILDEPTAVLAPSEVAGLLELLSGLAAEGTAVVLVAHKLDEVLAVADRVTVLRGGKTVLEAPRADVDGPTLAHAMVGRTVERVERSGRSAPPGRVVARLDALEWDDGEEGRALRGVSLEVREGEIVGVAGVEGNGQHELALLLAGRLQGSARGSAQGSAQESAQGSAQGSAQESAQGSAGGAELPDDPAFIPQDRREDGLVPRFDLTRNLALALHRDPLYRRGPFLRWGAIREAAQAAIDRYGVRASGPEALADSLSGGNQQKWVVARELERSPTLLVAENPTRGLDVASTAFVRAELLRLRDRPSPPGIVLLSTDLDEILELADRIYVMVRGELRPVPEGARHPEEIGRLMLSGEAAP